jgi:hypothetical protein
MNIGPLCSSPIDITLCVINRSCSCGFSAQLATDCHQEQVARVGCKLFMKIWSNIHITVA